FSLARSLITVKSSRVPSTYHNPVRSQVGQQLAPSIGSGGRAGEHNFIFSADFFRFIFHVEIETRVWPQPDIFLETLLFTEMSTIAGRRSQLATHLLPGTTMLCRGCF
ncbi:unnamed protein product, partial [Scytosiphon promiscuus]